MSDLVKVCKEVICQRTIINVMNVIILFELFQHITENPKRKCPACGKLKVVRVIGSGGAIIFKGSGFYQTDYRSEEYKSKAKKRPNLQNQQ